MKQATRERMASSAFPHWCTPPELCDLLHAFGNVALDPCSNAYSMVRAGVELRRGGLHATPWAQRAPELFTDAQAFAYVNSPYGPHLPRWTARVVLERAAGVEVVQLMPARIETRWFRAARDHASSIGVVRGRLRFWRRGKQRHPAFFPSALLYYGERVREFERLFSSIADFYRYVSPLQPVRVNTIPVGGTVGGVPVALLQQMVKPDARGRRFRPDFISIEVRR